MLAHDLQSASDGVWLGFKKTKSKFFEFCYLEFEFLLAGTLLSKIDQILMELILIHINVLG